MVERLNRTRPSELGCWDVHGNGNGCERLYGNNKCNDYTATESFDLDHDASKRVVFWQCNGQHRFNGKWRYGDLHVCLEYRSNNGGPYGLNSRNVYGNGNGCERLYSNNERNDHSTASSVGVNDKSSECAVLWKQHGQHQLNANGRNTIVCLLVE